MLTSKNITVRAAAVFITGSLLFATSCSGAKTPDDGYLLAEPDGGDYSYSYPEEWKVIRSDSMVAVEAPDGKANISSMQYELPLESFELSVYSESESPWSDLLDDYVNRENGGYISLLRENFGQNVDFPEEFISDFEVNEQKYPGKRLIYHIKVGEDDYYFETALIIMPSTDPTFCYLYDLTYTALGEDIYNEHKPVFDKVVSSFEFKMLG